ncbi:MAG TPA: SusC/RagA family TonB-linked outer membrane protein [Chryseosolibacter sp.]
MKKRLLGCLILLLTACCPLMAQQAVSGKVTSAVDGAGLPGVSVLVKGTTAGTSTDADGRFSINVPGSDAVLVFSFIGFTTQEVTVGGRTTIDVQLQEQISELTEVVVTALGIEREKKALTYSVQEVKTQELSEARELNIVNSLSGKVAGISINRAGSGVGAPTRVILRGNRSIFGDSQPIYIVDGVPIMGDISDIAPDDVESITVLKGPNAAALYGSRANNGVIVVTTKKGKAGGKGFTVDLNNTYMMEDPVLLTNYQNVYGQGSGGTYSPTSEFSWGPKMDGQMVAHWSPDPNRTEDQYPYSPQPNNVRDFFQTGHNFATSLAISAGNETNQTFFSYTYTDASGVVPTNDLTRHNVNVRFSNKLSNKLFLDTKINFIHEDIENQLSQGEDFSNPNRHIYRIPRNIRTRDIEDFDFLNADNQIRQNYWNPGSNGGANPYWTINRNQRKNGSDRVIAFSSLRYEVTKELSVMVRSAIDRGFGMSETKYYADSYIFAQFGRFYEGRSEAMEWNNDFLLSYNKTLNENFSFNVNVGGNSRKQRNTSLDSNTGTSLTLPNYFALSNTQQVVSTYGVGSPKDVNSLYGFAQVGYKNAIFLDLTARNDWSSTLPRDNWSFFYPSVGLNAVVSELTDLPRAISFAKVRASYAEVGNDTAPFQLSRTASFTAGGKNGYISLSPTLPAADLRPERTKSIEVGADLRFIDNRLGIDFTYYKTNSVDQLFSVSLPTGSGASQKFINGGDVENKGIEVVLDATPVIAGDFKWDLTLNFATNKSLVKEIAPELRPADGSPAKLNLGGDFLRRFIIQEGEPFGSVYSRGFLRDSQGRVIVGADGVPRITPGFTVNVANFNPDWLGGVRNSFTYKNFRFNFLIDIRQGGTLSSLTNAIIYADGVTEETLQGREGGLVFGDNFWSNETAVLDDGTPNNIPIKAEQFWVKMGGRNAPAGEVFVEDASNIRMREAVLGYSLPAALISRTPFRSVSLSIVGRNLFFLSNKANNIDPDVFVGTGKEAAGFDSFGPPTSRSYGFNLNLGF